MRKLLFLYWLAEHKTYPLRALSFNETIAEVIGHLRITAAPLRDIQPSRSVHSFGIGRNNPPASLVLAGSGKTLWPRENFDGLQMWRKQ
jgi:hypothetical protein